ncbi:MAG: hypothetical protein IKI75_05230 [Lachnospiraceae bacterium]|nr:hypothetical protein [Lachnospiraceae bacterium]
MRITNKVMQNNALSNINRNKVLQDDLNNQIATGKKIMKPSDDPVVAIRALRLRSDVSQVQQYYKKNIPDAQAWLSLTESSLKTTIEVVKSTVSECERGASDHLQTSDRQKIINSLSALRDEIYKTGDADYAGRYIFTGFRTDTSLSFGKPTERQYDITETFSFDDLEERPFVDTDDMNELTESNYESSVLVESDIQNRTYHRFRLAYKELDENTTIKLTKRPFEEGKDDPEPFQVNGKDLEVRTMPSGMTKEELYRKIEEADKAAEEDPDNAETLCYVIPETGELVMTKDVYEAINNFEEKDDKGNINRNLNITYSKTQWKGTDLRPEHYFYCNAQDTDEKVYSSLAAEPKALVKALRDAKKDDVTAAAAAYASATEEPETTYKSIADDAVTNLNERETLETAVTDAETGVKDAEDKVSGLEEELTTLQKQLQYYINMSSSGSSPMVDATKAAIEAKETELETARGELDTAKETYNTAVGERDKNLREYDDMVRKIENMLKLRIDYNPDYRFNLAKNPDQGIYYQVGFDQTVQVNAYASDVYKHAIGRDVDEIINLADEVEKAEQLVAKFTALQDDDNADQEKVKEKLDAAKKAETFLKDELQKTFSRYITKCQGYLDDANEAVTLTGNRDKRVSLAENRLNDQDTTFKTLQSNNEDADATEVAVQLSSAEVSYEAALMATGKMIQTTLLNYL